MRPFKPLLSLAIFCALAVPLKAYAITVKFSFENGTPPESVGELVSDGFSVDFTNAQYVQSNLQSHGAVWIAQKWLPGYAPVVATFSATASAVRIKAFPTQYGDLRPTLQAFDASGSLLGSATALPYSQACPSADPCPDESKIQLLEVTGEQIARIQLSGAIAPNPFNGNTPLFDDLQIELMPVPEPSPLVLIAATLLSGLIFVTWSRRQSQLA